MEGDEMEISKEDLQTWIREAVTKSELISPDILEKCKLLQSLLERRENRAAQLLKLCESVAACEATVRKQYSLLGWVYKDTDSDDDDSPTSSEHTPPSQCELIHSQDKAHCSPATGGRSPVLPKLQDSENLKRDCGKKRPLSVKREPVVVLTRLPESMISALCSPIPAKLSSEGELLCSSDSDVQWQLQDSLSDSSLKSRPRKRRKIHQPSNERLTKSPVLPPTSTNTDATRDTVKTSTPSTSTNVDVRRNTSAPQGSTKTESKRSTSKTSTPPSNTKVASSMCIVSAVCQSSDDTTSLQQEQICVNMKVLARRRAMNWQRGKIVEILTKEDGRLKYKVSFEEKGKILISGHHLAYDSLPKLEQLFVGARVVVKCQAQQPYFCPGVLAELPCRRNRMRFLVFTDDHTPIYVGLPLFHLVCRPLTDPLEDIPNDTHRDFIKEYLNSWPYPPQTQYRVGQLIKAEFNGVQQSCEVHVVDCSLIQVVFQIDQHKEWIYRGSMRLEHMINMREYLELKKEEGKKDKSTSESTKVQ